MEKITQKIAMAKKQLKKMQSEKIYKDDHIRAVRENLHKDIIELAKTSYQRKIYDIQKQQNSIIKRYNPNAKTADPEKPKNFTMDFEERYKHLPKEWKELQIDIDKRRGVVGFDVDGQPVYEGQQTSDYNPYEPAELPKVDTQAMLLKLKMAGASAKAARMVDIDKYIQNLQKHKTGDIEEINIYAAELRNRGEHQRADDLLDLVDRSNILEPWKNDFEFQQLARELVKFESFNAGAEDLIFLDDEGKEFISTDRLFSESGDEEDVQLGTLSKASPSELVSATGKA